MAEPNENAAENAPVAANPPTPVASEKPQDAALGVYAPFPYSPEPFAELSDKARLTLLGLDDIATKTDIAARRLEIEQAWEAIHFDRGYQHLLRGKNGGWVLPGNNTGFGPQAQLDTSAVYATNVYGPKGDIIVAALSREVPKIEFFPMNPEYAPDIVAEEEAENFKLIWSRNNNLHALLVECARIFWNEDRVLLWTRYELDGQKYGFEQSGEALPDSVNVNIAEQEEAEESPEEAAAEAGLAEPTGQDAQADVLAAGESPMSEGAEALLEEAEQAPDAAIINEAGGSRKPLGREVTTAFGKLDHKVPINVQERSQMPWVQIMIDVDVAIARATFPWIADKIKVGSDGTSESQLDRIARENVRQSILGAYVTGDSLNRRTTLKYTWFRPSFFLDESVEDDVKTELLDNFPNGCLLARAGREFAFARNESLDAHIAIAHPTSGKGQNRKAMGSALISVQKRINDWVDLMDDFFKRTIPKKWMNADAFDMEAIRTQPNTPGSIAPFLPQPGLTTPDQYIMVEPTPQPQAALPDFIKWFITSLSEEISGALPSLFGAPTNTETVGGIQIQRDQALQRVGCPWNNIQDLFAEAALQAVNCAKACREGKKISQNIPGSGNIVVNTANLAGNVLCYPESNPAFPESWAQKEQKLIDLINISSQVPALGEWLYSPTNLPVLADGIRMKAFKVPGASSVTKQRAEFEYLLRGAPVDNPQFLMLKNQLAEGMEQLKANNVPGQPIDPQVQATMEKGAQLLKTLPPKTSSVPVAQDESELHAVEADTCFQWMNSSEGIKFKNGDEKQKAAFENVHLHWQEHTAMAKKIAAANAPPQKPPSESLSVSVDKMPTNVAIQALGKMGIQATPEDFAQKAKEDLQSKVASKSIPDVLRSTGEEKAPPKESFGSASKAPTAGAQ